MAQAVLEYRSLFEGKPYSEIDCSHLVHQIYSKAGFSYPYTTTAGWPPSQFIKVATPEAGDVIHFEGHVGIYVSPGKFFGSQTSTGVKEASFGPDAYWGKTKKILGYYRYGA